MYDPKANMLSLKINILLLTNEFMTVMNIWYVSMAKKQVLHAEVIYLHLLIYYRPSPSLHYLCHRRHFESIMHKGQGAGRYFM